MKFQLKIRKKKKKKKRRPHRNSNLVNGIGGICLNHAMNHANIAFQTISSRKYPYSPHGRFFVLHRPSPQEIPVYFHTFLLKI